MNDILNIALCDDDKAFLNYLSESVKNCLMSAGFDPVTCAYSNPKKLIEAVVEEGKTFDLIVLDLDMPEMRGDELARELQRIASGYRLMFISNLHQEVFGMFQYGPSGFIPKSQLESMLRPELMRVVEEITYERENKELFSIVNDDDNSRSILQVEPSDIIYFENLKKTLYICVRPNRRYRLRGYTLEQLLNQYEEKGFVQTHRSIVVNIRCIFTVHSDSVEMVTGAELPLSRRKRQMVLEALSGYIGGVKRDDRKLPIHVCNDYR